MEYVIKELTYDTVDDYMQVNTACWLETYPGIVDDEFLNKISNEIEENITRKKNRFYDEDEMQYKKYLLYDNDKAIGMFSISKSRLENYNNSGEIVALYLLKKYHHSGLGKKMFLYALSELYKMGYNDVIIGCLAQNPTNEFYKHMGCKLIDTTIHKIGNQELEENIYHLDNIKQYL